MFKSSKERLEVCGINPKGNSRTLAMYVNHTVNGLRTDGAVKQYLLNRVETLLALDKQGYECKAIRDMVIVSDDNQKDSIIELTMIKHGQLRYETIIVNSINPDIVKALIA